VLYWVEETRTIVEHWGGMEGEEGNRECVGWSMGQ
jgi:hypothetical protein